MRYLLVLILLGFSACQFNGIYLVERSDSEQKEILNFLESESQLCSLTTHNFVNSRLLNSRLAKNPKEVLEKLAIEFEQKDAGLDKHYDEDLLISLADITLLIAQRHSDKDEALRYYLTSAKCAYRYMKLFISDRQENAFDPSSLYMVRVYNMAIRNVFLLLQEKGLAYSNSYTIFDIFNNPTSFGSCAYNDYLIDPKYVEDYIPCAKFKIVNFNQLSYQYGIGVPLIAKVDENSPPFGPARFPEALSLPVSLVLKFSGNSLIKPDRANFNFYWSNVRCITIGNKDYPLEVDYSTPIAYQFQRATFGQIISFTINPEALGNPDGLYLMEPYDPNRIPVVFVHGLLSSPPTWAQMINTLRSDPEIRKNYQFIFYSYSSGAPLLYSSAKLRHALKQLRTQVVNTHNDTAIKKFNEMVMVGHSMGGLLTKSQITYADSQFINHFPDSSYERIISNLDSHYLHQFNETIAFSPFDSIARVIFLATPHKGSHIAEWGIVNVLASIITLPTRLVEARQVLDSAGVMPVSKGRTLVQLATGIGNLAPTDIILTTLDTLRMKETVPFHSVIGNTKKDIPGGSDSIVPYESAHKEGARSELVIKHGHSVQENPLAILEVKRILIRHLKELQEKGKRVK